MVSLQGWPNKSLQGTFDPPPVFAAAKTAVASNAPALRRSDAMKEQHDASILDFVR